MKIKHSAVLFCTAAFGLLQPSVSAAPQQFVTPANLNALGVKPESVDAMDQLLQSFVDQQKLSCVVGFVAKDGNVVYKKAFGWKDVEAKVPATVDDYYVLFSQTKAITTVAFMTLVEDGLVAIDDPVSKYFPEIPNMVVTTVRPDGTYDAVPVKTPMTFVHLMTHTSGINAGLVKEIRKAQKAPDERPAAFGGEIPNPLPEGQHSAGGNYQSKYLEEEMLALAKYPLGFEPGTKWEYHVSTNMLGYLIERISKKSLRQYIKERVLDPLGMTQTDWYYPPEKLSRFVKPYRPVDGKLEPGPTLYSDGTVAAHQTYVEGAIGLNGPIEDYAKFCQMLLNGGEFNGHRILKPDTIRLMTTINRLPPDSGAQKGLQFGLGFELHRQNKPAPSVYDNAFSWGGMFGTAYIVDPAQKLVALYYINMYQSEPLYGKFLEQAYRVIGVPEVTAVTVSENAKEVVWEEGGTGPYSAIATEEAALPSMTIFRPKNLTAGGTSQKLPVLLWGNGACANTTFEHKNFLNEIASHGYIVLANGLLDQMEFRNDRSRQPTHSSQLIKALDWIFAQNNDPKSKYYGKIDTNKVAAMGMSCGGLQAIEISGDPRITTSVVCNSGVLPTPSPLKGMPALSKEILKTFHAPVLYLMGGRSDIAFNNAMDDYTRIDHVPIVMASLDVGHGGTYHLAHGGPYTKVALSWLDWQLKRDAKAAQVFLDPNSALRQDKEWQVLVKNFPTNQ
jgi:CubicO group peptidase (beta-lactamase class C family)